MKRRNFLQASGAVAIGSLLGGETGGMQPQVRYVAFNLPSDKTCAIYWMEGHRPIGDFVEMYRDLGGACATMQPVQVKHGWATFKLTRIGIYLSDAPLPNFEPITYWIPTDHGAAPAEPSHTWNIADGEIVTLEPRSLNEQEMAAMVKRELLKIVTDL